MTRPSDVLEIDMRVGEMTGSWFAVLTRLALVLALGVGPACGGAGTPNATTLPAPEEPVQPPTPTEPPQMSKAGHRIYNVDPRALAPLRVSGEKVVVPDDADKIRLVKDLKKRRVEGLFYLCFDETGHYENGLLVESTGLPGYDAKIARTMMAWEFRPYVMDGAAIPVCTRYKYVYRQR
jgi:hypothetical protein